MAVAGQFYSLLSHQNLECITCFSIPTTLYYPSYPSGFKFSPEDGGSKFLRNVGMCVPTSPHGVTAQKTNIADKHVTENTGKPGTIQ
jgi:hypothetical protein